MAGRIHVERAFRRVREFKFLAAHACADTHLLHTMDDAVNLVCGLINLQDSLIKSIQTVQYLFFNQTTVLVQYLISKIEVLFPLVFQHIVFHMESPQG